MVLVIETGQFISVATEEEENFKHKPTSVQKDAELEIVFVF